MILRYRISSAFRPPSVRSSVKAGVWAWRSSFQHEAPGKVMTRSSSVNYARRPVWCHEHTSSVAGDGEQAMRDRKRHLGDSLAAPRHLVA
jgi:hypothetical protein